MTSSNTGYFTRTFAFEAETSKPDALFEGLAWETCFLACPDRTGALDPMANREEQSLRVVVSVPAVLPDRVAASDPGVLFDLCGIESWFFVARVCMEVSIRLKMAGCKWLMEGLDV